MAQTTQYVKLKLTGVVINTGDGGIRCIKDFPEFNPHGEADQVEITTLCDEFHEYIDGLKSYAEALEFKANYDETVFGYLNSVHEYDSTATYAVGDLCRKDGVLYRCSTAIGTAEAWNIAHWTAVIVELLICESKSDVAGKNGKFSIAKADVSVKLVGAGVGDVLEMTYVIKPKSEIEFSVVA